MTINNKKKIDNLNSEKVVGWFDSKKFNRTKLKYLEGELRQYVRTMESQVNDFFIAKVKKADFSALKNVFKILFSVDYLTICSSVFLIEDNKNEIIIVFILKSLDNKILEINIIKTFGEYNFILEDFHKISFSEINNLLIKYLVKRKRSIKNVSIFLPINNIMAGGLLDLILYDNSFFTKYTIEDFKQKEWVKFFSKRKEMGSSDKIVNLISMDFSANDLFIFNDFILQKVEGSSNTYINYRFFNEYMEVIIYRFSALEKSCMLLLEGYLPLLTSVLTKENIDKISTKDFFRYHLSNWNRKAIEFTNGYFFTNNNNFFFKEEISVNCGHFIPRVYDIKSKVEFYNSLSFVEKNEIKIIKNSREDSFFYVKGYCVDEKPTSLSNNFFYVDLLTSHFVFEKQNINKKKI